jgi:hypothetical protein
VNPHLHYPSGTEFTPDLVHAFHEAALENIFKDSFEIDAHLGGYVDTFIDEDYVHGFRIKVELRTTTEQSRNHFVDDLFLYRCPSFIRPLWYNHPYPFFDYGMDRNQERREQFIRWYHSQGWANGRKPGDWWPPPLPAGTAS